MKNLIAFIIIILIVFRSQAQNPDFLIRTDLKQYKNLYKMDYSTEKVDIIYQSDKSYISKINISPNYEYISLIQTQKGTYKKESELVSVYDVPPKNSLIILDSDGYVIECNNDDVREYVWSPDSKYIAYITGTYVEGKDMGFFPTGFYILNIKTKEKNKIENLNYPYDLYWLKTEREIALYIRQMVFESNKKIIKYNLNKKRLEFTKVNGINFSPDGKYYIMYPYETIDGGLCDFPPKQVTTCFRVYFTKTNQVISEFSAKSLGTPVGWVYGQGHFLIFTKQEYSRYEKTAKKGDKTYTETLISGVKKSENFIYDVETKKLVQQFDGKVTNPKKWGEWIGSRDFIVVEKLGQSNQKTGKENEIIIKKIPAEYRMK